MPKSLNRYIDPQTGMILVDIGDDLTQDVVEALGQVGAVRVKFEDLPLARQMLLSQRQQGLLTTPNHKEG